MIDVDNIARKRAILLTTRMRFSPEIQPVRESALERIVQQIVYLADAEEGLSLPQIQDIFSLETG